MNILVVLGVFGGSWTTFESGPPEGGLFLTNFLFEMKGILARILKISLFKFLKSPKMNNG